VHVEDLRRQRVRFLAPCAIRSQWESTLETDTPPASSHAPLASAHARTAAGAVRVGLSRVAGLSTSTGQRILDARARRTYASLPDFLDRARPSRDEVEALILSGALDFTMRTRPSLLLEARVTAALGAAVRRRAGAPRATALVANDGTEVMPDAAAPLATPELPEFDLAERVRGEMRATGLWFAAHPLDALVAPEGRAGAVRAAALPSYAGKRVAIAGLPCAMRRVETRGGAVMLFLTVADRSGLAECVLFPDAYRAFAAAARSSAVRVEGCVDETLDSVTLTVENLRPLDV
jgi:error-prone DNA polymerase